MKPLRPDTFLLTLPNGEKVRCWKKDALLIRQDVAKRGSVSLWRDPATGVYDRLAPDEVQAVPEPMIRRIG